jgi:tetratricopeptide (TPR) repeat protein
MKDEVPEQSDTISVDLIREVQSRAQSLLKNEEFVGLWHDSLASTFRAFSHYSEAIVEYRLALEHLPNDWRIQVGLALGLGNDGKHAEAIATMTRLMEENKSLIGVNELFTERYWEIYLHQLGEWYTESKEYDKGVQTYRLLLEHGFEEETPSESTLKAIGNLLNIHTKQPRYDDAVSLLGELGNKEDEEKVDWATLTIRENSSSDFFNNNILVITKRTGRLAEICSIYERAIFTGEDLTAFQRARNMGVKYYFASLLWTTGTLEQQEHALHIWEDVAQEGTLPQYEEQISWLRMYSARK